MIISKKILSALFVLCSLTVNPTQDAFSQEIPFSVLKMLRHVNDALRQLPFLNPGRACPVETQTSFEPELCKEEVFGQSGDFILEPYWAQWRVGAHLKDMLLTDYEKDTDISVGFVDDGFQKENEAFKDLLRYCEEGPEDDPDQAYCHGTHVTGILCSQDERCSVGESTNSHLYAYQLPPRPKHPLPSREDQIYPAQISGKSLKPKIDHALKNGVRIMNLSLGTNLWTWSGIDQGDPQKGVGALLNQNNDKISVVVSAGNEKQQIQFPTYIDNLYPISSLNPMLDPSFFSNSSNQLAFSAPSDYLIRSTDAQIFGGTSGAAPVVSGTILNLLKVNPQLTSSQIKDILKITSQDLGPEGFDPQYGWGVPNLPKAILATRYIREGKWNVSGKHLENTKEEEARIKEKKKEFETILNKDLKEGVFGKELSFNEILNESHTCKEYASNVKKLFLNYFLTGQNQELCQFYLRHRIYTSAALYCDSKPADFEEKLLAVLKTGDENQQIAAMVSMPNSENKDVLDELIKHLSDENRALRGTAVNALAKMGNEAASHLREAYPHMTPKGKESVLFVLASMKDKKAVTLFRDIINSEESSEGLMTFAIYGLGEIRSEEAIGDLKNILRGEDSLSLRQTAIRALAKIETPAAQQALIDIFSDEMSDMTEEALAALGSLKEKALPKLLENFSSPNRFIRRNILMTLSHQDRIPSEATSLLMNYLTAENEVYAKKDAIYLLGKTEGPKAFEALNHFLELGNSNIELSFAAAKALGASHDPRAMGLLWNFGLKMNPSMPRDDLGAPRTNELATTMSKMEGAENILPEIENYFFNSPSWEAYHFGLMTLNAFGPKAAPLMVRIASEHPDSKIRDMATNSAWGLGQVAIDPLAQAIKKKKVPQNEDERETFKNLSRALLDIKDVSTIDQVTQMYREFEDPKLKREFMSALTDRDNILFPPKEKVERTIDLYEAETDPQVKTFLKAILHRIWRTHTDVQGGDRLDDETLSRLGEALERH